MPPDCPATTGLSAVLPANLSLFDEKYLQRPIIWPIAIHDGGGPHYRWARGEHGGTGIVSTQRDRGDRRGTGERGSTLVEFALIFPIFMTVVLGMFSGGSAYNQKAAMNSAAREGARYAATLPISGFSACSAATQLECWLHTVANYVENASEGSLGVGIAGWEVCVAYVYLPATGSQTNHETHALDKATQTGGFNKVMSGQCPGANDAPEDNKPRVQVVTRRSGSIDALFVTHSFTLSTKTITRFEALP